MSTNLILLILSFQTVRTVNVENINKGELARFIYYLGENGKEYKTDILNMLHSENYNSVDPGKNLNLELMLELERQPSNINLSKNILLKK
ncbi:MAG: hypothetical protein QXW79_00065 [Thermoplasmata archaeon]